MKKSCSILFALFTCFVLNVSAYTERNLLVNKATPEQVKESLVMNQAWVTYPKYADRAGWDKFLGTYKDMFIKDGEKYLDYKWEVIPVSAYLEYERSGNRQIMEYPQDRNNTAIVHLLMAELAEGQKRFLDKLIDGVFFTCEQTAWALSAHTPRQPSGRSIPSYDYKVFDLVNGDMGNMLSWTYYFMHDAFDKQDPEISRRLRHELQVRVMDSFLEHNEWWMGRGKKGTFQNNWNPWCNSNALITFMLLENDKDTLAKAVYLSMESVDQYLNYMKGDGAIDEGPSYWGHAAGKLMDYLEMLKTITNGKVDLFGDKLVRDMGEYIDRSYVGNGWVVNFADASAKGGGDPYLVYRYGKVVNSDEMKEYAALVRTPNERVYISRDVYRMLANIAVDKEFKAQKAGHTTAAFTWYPETEFCYLTNKDIFLATKGGNNGESHNHNDVGTVSVWMQETPILIDAGVGTYTRQTFGRERYSIWTMQSNYHNLPMINGIAEKDGIEYKSKNAIAKKNFFSVDISGAYPKEANVNKWVRSYDLKGKTVTVKDVFDLKEGVAANFIHFMTWGDVKLANGKASISVNGVNAELSFNPNLFEAKVEPIKLTDKRLSNVWGDTIYRISLTAKKLVTKGSYSYSLKEM